MNILVLGATGFIGKNVRDFFINKQGYCLFCPPRDELDVLSRDSVFSYLSDSSVDVVINCLDSEPTDKYFENRVRMFMNLASCDKLYKKMIYFGSGAEYGRQKELVSVSEKDIGNRIPTDSYGLALFTLNDIARKSDNIYNLRLFGVFGRYEIWRRRFISNAICKKLYGYPITIRQDRLMNYTDVADLMKVVEWFVNNNPQYHDYNVVQGLPVSLKDLATTVNSQKGNKVPIFVAKDGRTLEYSGNGDRLKDECGIVFRTIEESIEDLYKWYEERIETIDREPLLYQ